MYSGKVLGHFSFLMGDLEAPSVFPLKFETCSSFISVGKPSLDLGLNSSNENLIAEVLLLEYFLFCFVF